MEGSRYAAARGRRQYQLAEPENRLVVRRLEKDWETALVEADRLDQDYQRFRATRPATLSPAERDAIRALADNLPALWHASTTTVEDRKDILRAIVESITVAVVCDSDQVDVTICWAGNGKDSGSLRHERPDSSTYRIAANIARSSVRRRSPP